MHVCNPLIIIDITLNYNFHFQGHQHLALVEEYITILLKELCGFHLLVTMRRI